MTVAGVPLSGLLAGIANVTHDAVFADLTQDSRAVRPGSLFLACQGGRSHGLQYLQVALERGAAGVIWEPAPGIKPPALPLSVVGMAVPQLSAVAGQIAGRFFGAPSAALAITGITGTNGKTTCAWLLAQALTASGRESGYVGTLGVGLRGRLAGGELTTAASS